MPHQSKRRSADNRLGTIGTTSRSTHGTQPRAKWALDLNRNAGNKAAANYLRIQRRGSKKPARTMDFTDEGTTVTGARIDISSGGPHTAARDIEVLHDRLVRDLGRNANAAIKQFTDFMSFAADEEATVDGANAAFTFVRKALIDHYLGEAIGPLVKLVPVVGQAKGLVDALLAEAERAEKATGEVKIRDYLVDLSNSWNTKVDNLSKGLDGLGDRIEKQYWAISRSDGGTGDRPTNQTSQEGRTIISGPGAEFLGQLKSRAETARSAQPTAAGLLRQMVVKYATSQEGRIVGLGGGEVKTSGKIYLTNSMTIEGNSPSVNEISSGKLLSPTASKTASALNRVMATEGWTIHDLPIQKRMRVKVEHEIPWSNDYYTVDFFWTDPNELEHSAIVGSLHNDTPFVVPPKIRELIMLSWKFARFGSKNVTKIAS